jgi:hypothetical protein
VYGNGRGVQQASEITPLRWLEAARRSPRRRAGLAILELSNGPTLAFKDMAMQLLGNLFEYVLAKRGERSTSSAPPRATPAHRPNTRCAANKAARLHALATPADERLSACADVFAAR